MCSVLILLSTYNGEKYLNELLTSLFAQVGVRVSVLVRDDGSTDSTCSILNKFAIMYPDRIFIINGNNIGWKESFFKLIEIAGNSYRKFEYFAFADQDDIWEKDKLSIGVDSLKKLPLGPQLYCSNLYYYKDGKNYGKLYRHLPSPTYKNCLIRNIAAGCTIIFNLSLICILKDTKPAFPVAHDFWVYQVAVLCGNVTVDMNAHILYRQHSNNQIGHTRTKLEVWKQRLSSLKSSVKEHQREKQAQELGRLYSDYMNIEAKSAVDIVANYRKNIKNRLKLLFDFQFSTGLKSNDWWLRLRILFSGL